MLSLIFLNENLARDPRAPFEIIRLYLEAGGKADKCIMSHLDRKLFNFIYLNIITIRKEISSKNKQKFCIAIR